MRSNVIYAMITLLKLIVLFLIKNSHNKFGGNKMRKLSNIRKFISKQVKRARKNRGVIE